MVPGDRASRRVALRRLARWPRQPTPTAPIAPADALADVARRAGRMVVVVDQFEECWTRAPARTSAMRFLDCRRRGASRDESVDVRFVATVRADLLDRPLEHPTIGPLVGAGVVRPGPAVARRA